MISVAEVASADCPVSCITPHSKQLARILEENYMVREATGAAMFGSDSSIWPAWWSESVVLHQRYRDMEKGTFTEASIKDAQR